MTKPATFDRRAFIRRGAMGAGAMWALSLGELMGRRAEAAIPSPYGPVSPKADENTGLFLLQLPDGFRYVSYSWTGDVMTDGVLCPALHDGMAVVDVVGNGHGDNEDDDDGGHGGHGDDDDDQNDRRLILVRNHEVAGGVPFINGPSITFHRAGWPRMNRAISS